MGVTEGNERIPCGDAIPTRYHEMVSCGEDIGARAVDFLPWADAVPPPDAPAYVHYANSTRVGAADGLLVLAGEIGNPAALAGELASGLVLGVVLAYALTLPALAVMMWGGAR